jgi:hypothetical protein
VPRGPLQRALPPGPPGPVSRALGELLGWPNRLGPGGAADLTAVDAAVDQVRARLRTWLRTLLAALVAPAAVIILPLPVMASFALLGGTALAVTAVLVRTGEPRGPIRELVEPALGPDQPTLVRHATQAVLNARHPRPPHGPVATADGPR